MGALMARKDVLRGLLNPGPTPVDPPAPSPAASRPTRGAIGAVSRSIADLKARAVAEIDPLLIDAGGVQDRLEADSTEDAMLRESIAAHGQQVPVLVRPHPVEDGRYQIVYGRRRLLALRELGQTVKALIRDLDDRELVLAQGQENTARRDLSFIEKVNFARQLEDMGYDRKVICDALSVDKTLVSRMLSLAARIPADVIALIGAAPSIGRDRWMALADLLGELGANAETLQRALGPEAGAGTSDERFLAVWAHLERTKAGPRARGASPSNPAAVVIAGRDGQPLAQARLGDRGCTVQLRGAAVSDGFAPWLLEQLPALHAEWQTKNKPRN